MKFLFAIPKPNTAIKFAKQDASITESHTCFCQTDLHIGEFRLLPPPLLPFILDLSYSLSSLLISQLVPNQPIQKANAKIIPFMLLRPCQTFIFKSNPSSFASSSQLLNPRPRKTQHIPTALLSICSVHFKTFLLHIMLFRL